VARGERRSLHISWQRIKRLLNVLLKAPFRIEQTASHPESVRVADQIECQLRDEILVERGPAVTICSRACAFSRTRV